VDTGISLESANAEAVGRLLGADPVLVDVLPLAEAVPDFDRGAVLTSGPALAWDGYAGGQRSAIVGGAVFEGLARDPGDAEAKLASGAIRVRTCDEYRCVGSLAGIYTASMPVLVVENRESGSRAYCTLFEGVTRSRLTYGVYNDEVVRNLRFLNDVAGPVLGQAVRLAGGVPLLPIMKRALLMGDEMHSRNTAASLLVARSIFRELLQLDSGLREEVMSTVEYLQSSDYFFSSLALAAARAASDAAHGIEGSSLVTGMIFNCREFAIRVSGLGNRWFKGPLPAMLGGKFFRGATEADADWIGGESTFMETVGLGGFAQAAAFALQEYHNTSPEGMVAANLSMYGITLAEHPELKIPSLGFRGTPTGIDVHRVVDSGTLPVMNIGIAGRTGGQIGAGSFAAPIECFRGAAQAHSEAYR
jgi:hypothetical protein